MSLSVRSHKLPACGPQAGSLRLRPPAIVFKNRWRPTPPTGYSSPYERSAADCRDATGRRPSGRRLRRRVRRRGPNDRDLLPAVLPGPAAAEEPRLPADRGRRSPGRLSTMQAVSPAVGRRGDSGMGRQLLDHVDAEPARRLPDRRSAASASVGRRPPVLPSPFWDDLPVVLSRAAARRGVRKIKRGASLDTIALTTDTNHRADFATRSARHSASRRVRRTDRAPSSPGSKAR